MYSKPLAVAASQRCNAHHKTENLQGGDNDDGIIKESVAPMDENGDTGRSNRGKHSDEEEDGRINDCTLLSPNAPPWRSVPGAIRMQHSGPANSRANHLRSDEQDGERGVWQEVWEDLEQPPESVSSATTAIVPSTSSGRARYDTTDMICANIVDEQELETEFQKRTMFKMVEATQVQTEEEARTQQELEVVATTAALEEELRRKAKQRRMLMVAGIGSSLVMLLVLVLIGTFGKRKGLSDFAYLEEMFLPLSGDNIKIVGTPQYQALHWLAYKDPATLHIQSMSTVNLTQRYVMAVFFYATGGPMSWIDDQRFLSNYSVCEWPNRMGIEDDAGTDNEIKCNNNGEIVKIQVERNNLNGTIPKEIAALTALQILTTADNPNIVGTVPSQLGELSLLIFLQFAGCSLTGTFPETLRNLHSLETFSIFSNNLHGRFPVESFKDTIDNLFGRCQQYVYGDYTR
jgi:hypothetical protein